MQDPDLTAAAPRRCDQSSVTAVGGTQVRQRPQPGLSSRSCAIFAIMQRILAALAIAIPFMPHALKPPPQNCRLLSTFPGSKCGFCNRERMPIWG